VLPTIVVWTARGQTVASWDQIIIDHAPIVVRLTRRILGVGPDAEDVTQEVFLEAFQLQQRQAVTNWGGLLRMMATRSALDRLRFRRRRPTESLDGIEIPSSGSSAHENAVAAEMAERLRDAIAELPDGQAVVLSLRYFDNLSYEQIGETLHMEPNAVGAALYKARAKLQTVLKVEMRGAGS
jgi:RNA polymerase sigma factor (sigma-70 family)